MNTRTAADSPSPGPHAERAAAPDLVQSREAVKRAGRATRLLLVISVALLATLGAVFAILMDRQNALQESGREQALFAAHEIDRDARVLRDALARAEAAESALPEGLAQRYLALLGTVERMDAGATSLLREETAAFAGKLTAIRARAEALAPAFAPGSAEARRRAVGEARAHADLLLAHTEAFVAFTNERIAAAHARARDRVMQLQGLTLMVVAALAAATALLLLNLLQQVRSVRKAAAVLENSAEAMATAYAAAEAGNRAKSEFMATIGHEIRTPLHAILGMAELLSHGPLGPEEREKVEVITRSGTALLEMLNEILDFAKIEHGRMSVETVAFDVRQLTAEAASIAEVRAREASNRVSVVHGELPDGLWHRSDPTLIRRVLLNLLSNAVKFTSGGEVILRVGETPGGGALRFEVTDTGIGIPPEARQRLFSAFSQVDSSIARRFGGTGLGLVICKRIVEALGGSIGFDSTPGVGSRFWFEVPAERQAPPQLLAAPLPPGTAERLPVLRILVVEDHPVNRHVAQQFLRMLGQNVSLASDGAEGVAMATAEPFDLIFMDMQMPVMDGVAAARAIRASGNRARIIAMTANASGDGRARCAEAGMDGFEAKPITVKRLSALIAETARGCAASPPERVPPQVMTQKVWDEQRVGELLAAVGEEGLRDLLRLFQADVPALLSDLEKAGAAGDAAAADRALHAAKGAAANLGLVSVAALAESLRCVPPEPSVAERLAAEIARVGVLPITKTAA